MLQGVLLVPLFESISQAESQRHIKRRRSRRQTLGSSSLYRVSGPWVTLVERNNIHAVRRRNQSASPAHTCGHNKHMLDSDG
jgi:hypothetical protein